MCKVVNGSIDSSGYRRDLCSISLSYGLLFVFSDMVENDVVHEKVFPAKDYDWDEGMFEMVNELVKDLQDDLFTFMQTPEHANIVKGVKKKIDTGLHNAIYILEKEYVDLSILACYILFHLVFKRDKPIHQNFINVIDKSRLELIVNSFDSAGLSLKTKIQMNKLAKVCIEQF